MTFARSVTPVLLTYDERPNIERTLAALGWAESIVALDSGSTDGTAEVLAAHPRVRLSARRFDSHAEQWTHAVTRTAIETEWVLTLDADLVVSDALAEELRTIEPDPAVAAFRVPFEYRILGRRLRASLLAPQIRLYRRGRGRFVQDGHTQRLEVEGEVRDLSGPLIHDDRKSLGRWLASQDAYMRREAEKLLAAAPSALTSPDRVRRCIAIAPLAVPLYCLIAKRGLLDGRAGWYYALQRGVAEGLLSLHLLRKVMER
jgi:hypothetical protein